MGNLDRVLDLPPEGVDHYLDSEAVVPADSDGRPRCVAVMYHYVRDHQPPEMISLPGAVGGVRGLTRTQFRHQVEQLCRVMEPIDWPTFFAWQRGLASIPGQCFLLTFDDGLSDHARNVVPILDELGLRGVFFIPGEVLTSQRLLSAHAVHLLLSRIDDETLERELFDDLRRNGRTSFDWRTVIDSNEAETMYHYESPRRARLKYLLTSVLPIELRVLLVDTLFERFVGTSSRWAREWYLGWDDVAAMAAKGHTIGAHGYRHEPLTRFTPKKRREDLRQVAAVLSNGLGPDMRPLSYPFGAHDDDTCTACYEAGFSHAFTTERSWVRPAVDVFRLPRFDTIDVPALLDKDVACPVA